MKKLWKTDEELCIHRWSPSGHLSSGHLSSGHLRSGHQSSGHQSSGHVRSGHQVVTMLDPEMES